MATTTKSKARDEAAWDAIVVGSGMGGMSAAAALARTGHPVLLLEQYEKLGGLTHSFSRQRHQWDVGLHYLSCLAPGEFLRELLDWLCDEPIELVPLGAIFDVLHIGDAKPLSLSRPFEAQALDLKERFPGEGRAVDAWFEAVHQAHDAVVAVLQARALPRPFGAALEWWKRKAIQRWCARTTAEVAAEMTNNPDLTAALFAQWGDHGGRPSTASLAVHAMVAHSYLECGAWYPIGGASVIAEHMIPAIVKAGGEARAGVRVEQLLMEDGRVIGVETLDGDRILADVVVSDVGARETVDRLLPKAHGVDAWVADIRSFGPNLCHFTLYLGFEGDVEAAGASRANHWLYPTGETDVIWETAPQGTPPAMFVSFASLKDPSHEPGPNKSHSGEMLAWTDWSTVEGWANVPPGERGEDYAAFKKGVEAKLLEQFRAYFPELAQLIAFVELATPLSTVSITGHRRGAFYGLDVTPKRILSDALRMKTPLDGLYLTGQDVATPGIPGAMWGGLLCAAAIEPKGFTHLRGS